MNAITIFKAVSDNNRLRILNMLNIKSLCVCEIREVLQLANSTVSQHLKILKDAGLIIERKEGKWVNYSLNPRPADRRIREILNKLDFWIDDKEMAEKDLESARVVDRQIICC